ncbi:MAG: DUF5605 domain-containing protein [Sphaerochaetaceae bacterium]|nr:DUF5605 domain-containing protein [Spirochaetales bacterium]MDY5500684.1 DUF5605 domain-containing protein [Sphaerochaetaceae bacterium]
MAGKFRNYVTFSGRIYDNSLGFNTWGDNSARAAKFPDSFLVLYADFHTLGSFHYHFPEQGSWRVTQKDVWEMTSKDLGVHSGWFHARLEGKPWQLFVLERVS